MEIHDMYIHMSDNILLNIQIMHRKQENHTATSPCIRGQRRRIKKTLVQLKVNSHGFSKMANMCLRGNLNETPFKSDYFRDFN